MAERSSSEIVYALVVQRIAEGQSAAEAEAEFLTDEYFEAWYQDICAKLAQYEG